MAIDNNLTPFEDSSRSNFLKFKPAYNAEVLICFPISDRDWEALPPQDFINKHGAITDNDAQHLLFLIKDQNGNHAPSELFDKTIKGKDGKPLRNQRQLAEAHLKKWGVPVHFNPPKQQVGKVEINKNICPKYALEGESRHLNINGNIREHAYNYKNTTSTGAGAPDLLHHNGYKGVLTFRENGDGLDSIEASRKAHGYENGFSSLKSESNFYHDEDYIWSRSETWNTPEHRFKGYLNEGHSKDLEDVLVGKNNRYFGAEYVLKNAPNSPEASVLRYGFDDSTKHIPVAVKDFRGNTHVQIEIAQVNSAGHLQQTLRKLNEKTGVSIHRGPWAETAPDMNGVEKLTKAAVNELFDKVRNLPNTFVQDGQVLYGINDEKITSQGADFDKAFPRNKIFAATVGKSQGRNGSFRNAASLTNDLLPKATMDEIMAKRSQPAAISKFAPVATEEIKMEETAIPYQPDGSSSRFERVQQVDAKPYDPTSPPQATVAATYSSKRADILNRPPSRGDGDQKMSYSQ